MAKNVYARQSFLGPHSVRTLADLRVGIVGVGGGGSHVAQQLAHVGVGHFVIPDPDVLKAHNLNRTVGARWNDINRKTAKGRIAERLIRGVNPRARVVARPVGWADMRLELATCDALLGCLDTYQQRAELEAFARRYQIPYLDIGMDVTGQEGEYVISGQVIASIPGYPCMRCLGFLTEAKLAREAARYGMAGPRPQVVWSNGTLASAAVGVVVRWFCPWRRADTGLTYLDYDGNRDRLTEHNRLLYLSDIRCGHYAHLGSVGDPFWKATRARRRQA